MIEHGYLLRVFEAKKKFLAVMKNDSKKQEMRKKKFSCIKQKFRGFDTGSIEYDRKNGIKFRPIDIKHKPVQKWHGIIVAFQQT